MAFTRFQVASASDSNACATVSASAKPIGSPRSARSKEVWLSEGTKPSHARVLGGGYLVRACQRWVSTPFTKSQPPKVSSNNAPGP